MKKILFILFTLNTFILADESTNLILHEIKVLREDMNKQVNALREDMNKQVNTLRGDMNKRFEQVDKRIDNMNTILLVVMALIFASPFIAIYLRDRREESDKKQFDKLRGVIIALKEMAEDNEKLARSLKYSNI